jgi:outer membrane lipopolysaccharide assembly protein LptE/RlpB
MKTKFPRNRAAIVIAVAAVVLTAGACGYYSTKSRTAKDIKSVAVPFFENNTSEPNLEVTITEKIIENLVLDNTLKVKDEAYADAVLTGVVVEFFNRPFSFDIELNAQEYHVIIKVRATLFDRRKNVKIWADKIIGGDGNYFVDAVGEPTQTFDGAVEESIREITERILNMTVQDW